MGIIESMGTCRGGLGKQEPRVTDAMQQNPRPRSPTKNSRAEADCCTRSCLTFKCSLHLCFTSSRLKAWRVTDWLSLHCMPQVGSEEALTFPSLPQDELGVRKRFCPWGILPQTEKGVLRGGGCCGQQARWHLPSTGGQEELHEAGEMPTVNAG